MAARIQRKYVDDRVPEHRDSHASSSHGLSLEPSRSADLGKHSVYTHFSKDRSCEMCQRTQNHKGPVQKTHWQSRTSCGKFWRFDYSRSQLQQITKFSVKVVNLETITDMQSWCKTWPPNGSSRTRAKQKLPRKRTGAWKSSWNPTRNPKVIYTDNSIGIWQSL